MAGEMQIPVLPDISFGVTARNTHSLPQNCVRAQRHRVTGVKELNQESG